MWQQMRLNICVSTHIKVRHPVCRVRRLLFFTDQKCISKKNGPDFLFIYADWTLIAVPVHQLLPCRIKMLLKAGRTWVWRPVLYFFIYKSDNFEFFMFTRNTSYYTKKYPPASVCCHSDSVVHSFPIQQKEQLNQTLISPLVCRAV